MRSECVNTKRKKIMYRPQRPTQSRHSRCSRCSQLAPTNTSVKEYAAAHIILEFLSSGLTYSPYILAAFLTKHTVCVRFACVRKDGIRAPRCACLCASVVNIHRRHRRLPIHFFIQAEHTFSALPMVFVRRKCVYM